MEARAPLEELIENKELVRTIISDHIRIAIILRSHTYCSLYNTSPLLLGRGIYR